jgi:phospholipase/carboxylesterase
VVRKLTGPEETTVRESEGAVVLDPSGPLKGIVVVLHGLGADGYDLIPLAEALGLPERGLQVVLPHAPRRPVTINRGFVMRAWYDVLEPDFARAPDESGIRASVAQVRALVDRLTGGDVPSEQVVLAGFSQGGVVALETGLRHPRRLAGVIALSTYLALPEALEHEGATANRGLPIFMGHGDQDSLIPPELGDGSARRLRELGYAVEFRRYRMGHSLCEAESLDIDAWLRRTLG